MCTKEPFPVKANVGIIAKQRLYNVTVGISTEHMIRSNKDDEKKKMKTSTAPGIPRRSPIQVLTGLGVA